MLLHGFSGTGKSFFIKRAKNCTDVKMQITATSGIAVMSLNGSTIDWLIDKGYNNKIEEEPFAYPSGGEIFRFILHGAPWM